MTDDFKKVDPPVENLTETAAEDKNNNSTIEQGIGAVATGQFDGAESAHNASSETFKTPDQVAASDGEPAANLPEPAPEDKTELTAVADDANASSSTPQTKKPGWRNRLALNWPPHKKEYIVLAVVALLFISGGAAAALHKSSPKPVLAAAPVVKKIVPKVVKPTTVPSTLSGLPVDPTVNSRPVTAAMIENSLDARPQSGLSQASVVFEAVAEGGVTRFMAIFQDTQPTNIGPIRSARPYYEQWALGFDAGYAHVGGSTDGLADIKSWNVRDLDQFYNSNSYHRITTRDAPHNVYTGVDTLTQLEQAKGYTTSTYTGFVRKAAEAPAKVPTAKSIDVNISGPVYAAHYDYNATTNSYNRSEDGTPQTDANSSAQLSPKVVVAMQLPESQGALDSSGAYYSDYNPIGSGPVSIFQDGTVTTGTWSKASNTAQITFSDATGKPIGLNPGQTWITAITSPGEVSYTP